MATKHDVNKTMATVQPDCLFAERDVWLPPMGTCPGAANTPPTQNLLRGGPSNTAPVAVPVQIAGDGGVSPYNTDLNNWLDSWQAPQAIYDQGTYANSEDYWSNLDENVGWGSTWNNNSDGIGYLVVDLLDVRTIDRFSVFQMFSDGKTTHIQFFKHSATVSAPDYTDTGWVAVEDEHVVDAGLNDSSLGRIASPTKISVTAFSTRFLKISVRNDGSYGDSD
ncbi:MAG: hypothetical protein ACKO4U_00485, partial [Caldilinea sp.]